MGPFSFYTTNIFSEITVETGHIRGQKKLYNCWTKIRNFGHCDYMEERMNACQKLIDLTNAGEFKFSQECYRKETGEKEGQY